MSRNAGHSWGVESTGLWTSSPVTVSLWYSFLFRWNRLAAAIQVSMFIWYLFISTFWTLESITFYVDTSEELDQMDYKHNNNLSGEWDINGKPVIPLGRTRRTHLCHHWIYWSFILGNVRSKTKGVINKTFYEISMNADRTRGELGGTVSSRKESITESIWFCPLFSPWNVS